MANEQELPAGIPNGAAVVKEEPKVEVKPEPKVPDLREEEPNVGAEAVKPKEELKPAEKESEEKVEPNDTDEPKEKQEFADQLASDPVLVPIAEFIEDSFNEVGADYKRAFGKGLEAGDPRFFDEVYLEEQFGKDKAAKILRQATHLFNATQQAATARTDKLFSDPDIGGKKVFDQAVKHFNESADPLVKKEITLMFDSGDDDLIKAGMKRIVSYGKEKGVVLDHKSPIKGDASSKQDRDWETLR